MRKIISLIILISFLFTNTAYPLTALRPPIDKGKKRPRETANEVAYSKIAKWINENMGNKGDIEKITEELKDGKLVFKYKLVSKYEFKNSDYEFKEDFKKGFDWEFKVDFVRGFYSTYKFKDMHFDYSYKMIPKDISELASKVLRKSQRLISEHGIEYLNKKKGGLITSVAKAWELKIKIDEKITNHIIIYLRSLGRNAPTSMLSKKIITKYLLKLQLKMPEAKPIIREKALELVEIDRGNFREGLKPFIIDYIALRDAIKKTGLKDDTRDFYNLFDEIVAWMQTGQHEKEFERSMKFIETIPKEFERSTKFIETIPDEYESFTVSKSSLGDRKSTALEFVESHHLVKAYLFKKKYGGFKVECKYTPEGTSREADWDKVEVGGIGKRQTGRLSAYPEQAPERKVYKGSKLKYTITKHPPSAKFKIFPKTVPAKPTSGRRKNL